MDNTSVVVDCFALSVAPSARINEGNSLSREVMACSALRRTTPVINSGEIGTARYRGSRTSSMKNRSPGSPGPYPNMPAAVIPMMRNERPPPIPSDAHSFRSPGARSSG